MDEESIFHLALEKTRSERAAFLAENCAGDAEFRRRVEVLLEAHDNTHGFLLDIPPAGLNVAIEQPVTERPGAVIGPYKLLQQIGEGGMGVVFMAEQTDPIQRSVALKIIKPGMDTRQVIARFEAERQAVAMMDHPNIAKVLDAGMTDSGRPYFVMELVKGVPITKYCDEKLLPLRARLELFVQVCQAVQHAHQKGIIHRDIKPNNVLVAEYDNQAVPKVIDFGVAKATAQKLTERTMFTEFGQVLGTVEYMSPEQAKLNQLDIDTRSDIYSLGVLLYELLVGSTPFEGQRLHEAAFDEMLRIIREEEPPTPSTRLSSTAQLLSVAANRGLEPAKLGGLVKGELDWIAMKALEKDRNRRYETANGFAADIQHYLRDEPVLACSPSAAYRFRKFALRNKAALFAVSAVVATLALLVIGLAMSNRLIAAERNEKADALREKQAALEQAEAQRKRAEESFRRARVSIRNILADAALGVGEWSQLPASLREKFTKETVNFYQSLLQDERHDPSLQYETAIGYRSLSALHERLREYEVAEKFAGQAIAILNALTIKYPNDVEYWHQLAWSHVVLGHLLRNTSRPTEAEAAFQRAATIYEDLITERPGIDYLFELAKSYEMLIHLQHGRGALSEEVNTSERLRDLLPNIVACFNTESGFSAETVDALLKAEGPERIANQCNELALLLATGLDARWRDPSAAVHLASKAVELVPLEGSFWNTLGMASYRAGDSKSAIEALRKAAELRAGGKADNLKAEVVLVNLLQKAGNIDETLARYIEVIATRPDDPASHYGLGSVYAFGGQWEKAAAAFQRAVELSPADLPSLSKWAALCFYTDDRENYRRACRGLLEHFSQTDNIQIADCAAKACALAPDFGGNAQRVINLADNAVFETEAGPAREWFEITKGLVDYRAGRFGPAAEIIMGSAPSNDGIHRDALAFSILAMTHYRLDKVDDARIALTTAQRIISTKMPKIEKGEIFGDDWHDWLHAQILCREAEELLKELEPKRSDR